MGDILTDLSTTNLIIAIEENLQSWLPIFGKMGRIYLKNPAGVKRSITNIPLSLLNSVMDTHLTPEKVDDAIQTVKADAILHKVPVLWWLGPSSQPTNLNEYLEKHDFKIDDSGPGMAVDLANVNVNLRAPAGLSITLAQDEAAWQQWSSVLAEGFEATPPHDRIVNGWASLLRHTDPQTTFAYIAWLNERPVATSLLFLASGVAGICAVSTIPEARREGVGGWTTLHALLQARDRDYHAAVLQASEISAGVYRNLGFQEICQISNYVWRPNN